MPRGSPKARKYSGTAALTYAMSYMIKYGHGSNARNTEIRVLAVLSPLAQARSFASAMPRMSYVFVEYAAAAGTSARAYGGQAWNKS